MTRQGRLKTGSLFPTRTFFSFFLLAERGRGPGGWWHKRTRIVSRKKGDERPSGLFVRLSLFDNGLATASDRKVCKRERQADVCVYWQIKSIVVSVIWDFLYTFLLPLQCLHHSDSSSRRDRRILAHTAETLKFVGDFWISWYSSLSSFVLRFFEDYFSDIRFAEINCQISRVKSKANLATHCQLIFTIGCLWIIVLGV